MANYMMEWTKWVGLRLIILAALAYLWIFFKLQVQHDQLIVKWSSTDRRENRELSSTHRRENRDELEELKHLTEMHVQEIEGVRDIFVKQVSHGNISILDIRYTAIGRKKEYFDILSRYPEIVTLFLSHPFSVVKKTLRQVYYQYGSNNCSLSEDISTYGRGAGLRLFNKSCQSDLNMLVKPGPLVFSHLEHGTPEGFRHTVDNVTLAYLSVIPDAVIQKSGDVRHRDLRILPQRCKQKIMLSDTGSEVYEEVFTMAQYYGRAFYHVLVQHLPRITPYVDFLKRHPSIKIHVSYQVPLIDTYLKALGLSTDRVVAGTVRARILYLPAGNPCDLGPIYNTQLLSAYLRSIIPEKADLSQKDMGKTTSDEKHSLSESGVIQSEPKNLVILQKRSRRRWFDNHTAIAQAIEEEANARGLELAIFDDKNLPSLVDTVALYDRAVLVVAPHGAGLSNMIFARPGTPLIEGMCQPPQFCYRNLNQNLGLPYYGMLRSDINCFATEPSDLLPAVTHFLDNQTV